MEDHVAMELAIKEQSRCFEDLKALHLVHQTRVDSKMRDVVDRVSKETQERVHEYAEAISGISEERTARTESQLVERHLLQDMLGRTEETINKFILEERQCRRDGDLGLDAKCNQLKTAIEVSRIAQAKEAREASSLERDREAAHQALAQTIADTKAAFDSSTQMHMQSHAAVQSDLQHVKHLLEKETLQRDAVNAKLQATLEMENKSREEALTREAHLRREGQARASQALNEALSRERQSRERGDLRLESQLLEMQMQHAGLMKPDLESATRCTKLQDDLSSIHTRLAELHGRLARAKIIEAENLDSLEALTRGLPNN